MKVENLLELAGKEYLISEVSVGTELESSTGCFFGLGLSSRNSLTKELPFDAIGMVLTAEVVKRELGLETATLLIANEHAKTNGFDSNEIDRIATSRHALLSGAIKNMGFAGWNVVLASDMSKDPAYSSVLSGLGDGNAYEKMQTANVEHFRRRGIKIKIGWMHEGMDFDERCFDSMYRMQFGNAETFVYTEAGRSLDGTRLPPYLEPSAKERLFLRKGEDIARKVDLMPRTVRKHYIKILNKLENLTGSSLDINGTVEEKLKSGLEHTYTQIFGYFGPQGSIIFSLNLDLLHRKIPPFRLVLSIYIPINECNGNIYIVVGTYKYLWEQTCYHP